MLAGSKRSQPSGSGRLAIAGRPSVIRVRAIGEIAFAVTPYRSISIAVTIVRLAMAALAGP